MSFFQSPGRRRGEQERLRARRRRVLLKLESLEDRTMPAAVNPIVAENQLPGTPQSVWAIQGSGDPTIQGFADNISVNVGQTINFKIDDTAHAAYHVDIYRMGYYQGNGARLITTISSSQTLDTVQPAALVQASTGLVDAGNWSVSASWAVPTTAVSGIYFADVVRNDTGGTSQIFWIVRNDGSHSSVLFQTSDATWEAYNQWGGSSVYVGNSTASNDGRAYAVSYNRPFDNMDNPGGLGTYDFVWHSEFPMVQWLEQNGYDVTYFTDVDADRFGSLIQNHQIYLSVGHDEYWSANQRANVEAALGKGVNLGFFSGNEVFWETRYGASIDGANIPYRTLICYKDTLSEQQLDPNDQAPNFGWTGTWMDPTFSPPDHGGQPQNALTGQLFLVNRGPTDLGGSMNVAGGQTYDQLWKNTSIYQSPTGSKQTLGANDAVLGYEWDVAVDNGFQPAGEITLTSTTESVPQYLIDYGNTFVPSVATHSISLYRSSSGALVFGAGTVQWSWGLNGDHSDGSSTPDANMEQFTVNLFAAMGDVQPGSLASGLVPGLPFANTTAPQSQITSPAAGATVTAGVPVTVTGTAQAFNGGVVAGVEISTDDGTTWHYAVPTGTTGTGWQTWSYTWTPTTGGPAVIETRATDDSCNTEVPSDFKTVKVVFAPTSTSGLVLAYNFSEGSGNTAHDLSGKGNNGTITGASFLLHGGVFGTNALSFNGQNSVITVPNAASLDLTSGMTLEAWVQPATASQQTNATVIAKDRSGGLSYDLYASTGVGQPAEGDVFANGSETSASGSSALPVNQWSFLTATYNESQLLLYVNGQLVGHFNFAENDPLATSNGALEIGGNSVFGEFFQGLISNVRIYNVALNQGQILSDMATAVGASQAYSGSPSVAITGPGNGASVSGSTTLTVNATDSVGVAGVQYYLNGNLLGQEVTTAPFSLQWNTTTVPNGSYTLTAQTVNYAGSTAMAAPVTVTVNNPADTTPPTVALTYPTVNFPATGFNAGAGTVVLSAIASDPVGVASVQFLLTPTGGGSPIVAGTVTSAPYLLAWNSANVAAGTYTLTAVATDTAGLTATSSGVPVTINHTPPTVTTESPTSGSTAVSTASPVTLTFSEAMQPDTISLVIKDTEGDVAPGTANFDPSTNTLTFTHTGTAFEPLKNYTVTASGGLDLAGNMMAPVSWSFTTGPTILNASLFNANSVPTVSSAADNTALDLGAEFFSDVAGYVTGIRFFKGAANTGTHVGYLWTAAGALLTSVTFTNETSFGWQQANFANPVAISANTEYVVSYYAPNGGYAADGGYFANAGVNSGPLHAQQSSLATPNGIFGYGQSFPTGTFNATNYWVDVVFSTALPPTVVTESPPPNSTLVSPSTTVSATFSEAVNANTISFVLKDSGGNTVPANLSYNSGTATLTPVSALAFSTTYTATVSGATDQAGNVMTPTSWSFTTTPYIAAPAVLAESPTVNATGVSPVVPISVTLNEDINVQQFPPSFVVKDAHGNVIAGVVSYSNDDQFTLSFTPSAPLSFSTTYTATVNNLVDFNGHPMPQPFTWSFGTTAPYTNQSIWASSTTPQVASAADNSPLSLGVKFQSSLPGYITGIRFYKGSANTGTHTGYLWMANGTLLATATFTNETATGWQQVNFSSPVPIAANVTYVASYFAPNGGYAYSSGYFANSGAVNGPLQALANGASGANGLFSFGATFPTSTYNSNNYWVDVVYNSVASDPTPPTVTAVTPVNGSVQVPRSTTVTATFSEPVTLFPNSFLLKDSSGNVVPANVTYNPATYTATLTPTSGLATSTTYTATASGATDLAGNTLAPFSWSFSTVGAVVDTIWPTTTVPSVASSGDLSAVNLGVKFTSDNSGFITGIRFYKGTGNNGTHVGYLWTDGGVLLASATFTTESATGWQQVNFSQPVAIAAGTTYVASYYAPDGDYAASGGYFATSGADNAPLHALANGVDGADGVYAYGGAGIFPTASYNSTNYWVDVVFSPTVPNPAAPTVTAVSPQANATSVANSAAVTATFSEAINPASLNFTLTGPSGAVAGSVAYSAATNSATFTPAAALQPGATYTASVQASDAVGDAMPSPFTWSFTVAGGITIFSPSSVPAVPSAADPSAIEVGVKFTSDEAGYVTGIRFYKGTGNTGTHVGHLWTDAGVLLATATFTGESASGWQQVNFSQPVAIAANTSYVASYFAPNGDYSVTGGFFATSGADNAPLHALASGVDGPNGLYLYGGGFPTQSYNSTNYWVDVVFSASSSGAVPPSVTAETPAPNATGVATSTTLSAAFSEAINPSTLVFTLTGPSGAVAGSVSYSAATDKATFTPTSALQPGATYTASIRASDTVGDAMPSPFTWSFTTQGTGSWQQNTVAQFNTGTTNGTQVSAASGGGQVGLAAGISDNFATLNSATWTTTPWVSGGGATPAVSNGTGLAVAGAEVLSSAKSAYTPVEASVSFAPAPYQYFGLSTGLSSTSGNYWAMFGTAGTSDTLFAVVNANGATNTVSLGAIPSGFHTYEVAPIPGAFQFYVDGVLQTTIAAGTADGVALNIVLSSYNTGAGSTLQAQWVNQGGTFVSSVFNALQAVNWGTATWSANVPAGTTLTVLTRSGNTATPDSSWSAWTAVSNGGSVASPSGQYLQYVVILTTTTPGLTADLTSITFTFS